MPFLRHEGRRLAYTVHGRGPRTTVLLPGLLLSQRMQEPLARALAARGNRVVTLDFLGHGDSDRPADSWLYSIRSFAFQAIALLDHLELDAVVLGGTSLGANVTLEAASLAPERLRGMIVEMPVLEGALPACAVAFTPLLLALRFGGPAVGVLARVAGAVPRRALPFLLRLGADWIAQDPERSAAVLAGILYGRAAPDRLERRALTTPALVIGHRRDPLHPFSDANTLAEELPNARLLHATSVLELRLRPERLTGSIAEFVRECWERDEPPALPRPSAARAVRAGR